jgi:hypothetical protein
LVVALRIPVEHHRKPKGQVLWVKAPPAGDKLMFTLLFSSPDAQPDEPLRVGDTIVGFLDSPRERVWVTARVEPMDATEIAHFDELLRDLRITPGGDDPPDSILGASLTGIATSQKGYRYRGHRVRTRNVGPPVTDEG